MDEREGGAPGSLTIGLLFGLMRERYTASIWPVVLETARRENVSVLLLPETNSRVCHAYADDVDALIILSGDLSLYPWPKGFPGFLRRFPRVPKVHLSMDFPGEHCCGIDNRSGIREAISHIVLCHGVRDIAFITGPEGHQECDIRFEAYREALAEFGIPYRPELVYSGDLFKESGVAALSVFLDVRHVPLKAVLSSNDVMALALMEAAFERGLNVPQDFIVVGFDDTEGALTCRVPLTTVRQPYTALAQAATLAAIALAKGQEPPPHEPLMPTLVVRNSCGCFSESVRSIPSSPPEGARPRDAGAWAEGLEPGLLAALAPSRLSPPERLSAARSLIGLFRSAETGQAEFLETVGDCLFRESRSGGNPDVWHSFLSLLGADPGPFPGEAWFRRSAILQQSRILVEEYKTRMFFGDSIRQYFNNLNAERLVSRILMDLTREKFLSVLLEELPKAGIPSAVAALYDRPLSLEKGDSGVADARLRPLFAYRIDDPEYGAGPLPDYPAAGLFPPGFLRPGARHDYILMPINHSGEEYGVLLQEVRFLNDGVCFDTIGHQVSAVFKRVLIEEERANAVRDLRDTLESLNDANQKLFGLARMDELSGLLNRRGFMETATQNFSLAKRIDLQFVAFFMDLDGLKAINDTYGHDAGDAAIKGLADILKKAYRSTDLLARLGGDEFVAFSFMNEASIPIMRRRLSELVRSFNAESGRPWALSVSVGAASFSRGRHGNIEDLLKDADQEAYREKQAKRGGR
jgi:diguanylate cyclase (GGDEF)-like protein